MSEDFYIEAYRKLKKAWRFHRVDDYLDDVELIQMGGIKGTPLIFNPAVEFRPGEVTVWGGINGHGKSLLTGQIALQMARAGNRIAIISLEMTPGRTLYRMWRQFLGHKPTPEDSAEEFLSKLKDRMIVLNYLGAIDVEVILGAVTVAGTPMSQDGWECKHIFIDNLMRCVSGDGGERTMNDQKNFVQALTEIAQALRIHIHLVHHVRKGATEEERIGKFSFKGSGAIVDQVDNAITIQRNRAKEKKAQENSLGYQEDASESDSWLTVCKQRNGDWEGEVDLWFDPSSAAFSANPDRKIRWFLNEK
jgi:twinkle protein